MKLSKALIIHFSIHMTDWSSTLDTDLRKVCRIEIQVRAFRTSTKLQHNLFPPPNNLQDSSEISQKKLIKKIS